MTKEEIIRKMNHAGNRAEPFLFIIDFEMRNCIFTSLEDLNKEIYYSIGKFYHLPQNIRKHEEFYFKKYPVDFSVYEKAFQEVMTKINTGYSYLTNLTFPSKIDTNLSLEEIFTRSSSSYKLLLPGNFVSFSPECFVKIQDGIISTYPMKGTIDASLPDAEKIILNDPKETAEHYIIVDLLRNDLSQVATDVQVTRFRYIDKIQTNEKSLLQVSSVISGALPSNFRMNLGNIIFSMLPAGSISGAPKIATLKIIQESEIDSRNFYSGIWGIFDGKDLESAVIIRYMEQTENGLIYRSGGGITSQSKVEREYQELIDKVYVPFN